MSEPSEPKPKRRFWQFHLSTALLMMLSIGPLMALNAKERPEIPFIAKPCYEKGWPAAYYRKFILPQPGASPVVVFYPAGLAINVLIGAACIAIVGFVGEYLIRRREGRKP